jgi:hypothetical protein
MPRLHWSPVEPSWIVAIGLIILASLPHQIPQTGRRALHHPIGALLFATLSAYVAWQVPVLGAAMFILLAGVMMHTEPIHEHFAATNLNKDKIRTKQVHKWLDEEVLSEDPHGIQERTENPIISYDEVTENQAEPWHDERVLDEQPRGIQEKAVGDVPEYDEGGASYGHH